MECLKIRRYTFINGDYKPSDTIGFKANHIPYKVFYPDATGLIPMVENPQEFIASLSNMPAKL